MSFLIEINPHQLAYLTSILDKQTAVPGDQVMHHAGIRQQLANPQPAEKVVEQLRNEGYQKALSEQRRDTIPTPGPTPGPMPEPLQK